MNMLNSKKIPYKEHLKWSRSLNKDKNTSIDKCHQTVGKAIISTSITIIFGFSQINYCLEGILDPLL